MRADFGLIVQPEPRYVLKAFVHPGGRVEPQADEGSLTAHGVFLRRPDGCRLAVVQARDEFWVVDLLELVYVYMSADSRRIEIDKYRSYPTLDAAIAAAAIQS